VERKFVLLIDSPGGHYCHRGEGTIDQVKKDLRNLKTDPSDIEILPVIGSRKSIITKDLGLGLVIGAGLSFLLSKVYKRYLKRKWKQDLA